MSKEGKPLQEAFTRFYCDQCREPIESVQDGYVIWRTGDQGYRDFKVIHQKKCDQNSLLFVGSAALKDFLGVRGQAYLGSFLSAGPIRALLGTKNHSNVMAAHFWRRMQLPNYEEARRRFHDVNLLNDYADASETLPYVQLDKIIAKYPDPAEAE